MLEVQLASDAARVVLDEAARGKVMKVLEVDLSIGAMRQVDEDLFKRQLSAYFENTLASGAQIKITRIPVTMRCKQCGEVYDVTVGDKSTYECPKCGSAERELQTGMEFGLNDMKVIVPSPHEGPSLADKIAQAVEDALGPVEPRQEGDGSKDGGENA